MDSFVTTIVLDLLVNTLFSLEFATKTVLKTSMSFFILVSIYVFPVLVYKEVNKSVLL